MNRIIKFRAWLNSKMVYWGSPYVDDLLLHFGILDPKSMNSDYINMSGREYQLMQFTGLLDKNGTEIYEGDIVWYRVPSKSWGSQKWSQSSKRVINWTIKSQKVGWNIGGEPKYFEVIGNIYENEIHTPNTR